MAKTEMVRKRINVPKTATDILEWMEQQTDVSVSLRLLIQDFIEDHGCVDRVGVSLVHNQDRLSVNKRKAMTHANIRTIDRSEKQPSTNQNAEVQKIEKQDEVPKVMPDVLETNREQPFRQVDMSAYQTPAGTESAGNFQYDDDFDMAAILGTL